MGDQQYPTLCADCLKRDTCDSIPREMRLLRCLDRQTAAKETAIGRQDHAGRPAAGAPAIG
ncbi:MAG: hypothetical protein PHN82_08120 [bacterium]|nr:hypothetical protein [bacterium]